ncbi:UNVERIFIED_CONTAM: hypothetical protein Sangu_2843500 [Sesamum angustifolium]|uniref:Uncharacterized protein n=1 Tax=Sesamum angustifolium TaxID=2727405 RepID=A0AAW2IPY0_9LAMI
MFRATVSSSLLAFLDARFTRKERLLAKAWVRCEGFGCHQLLSTPLALTAWDRKTSGFVNVSITFSWILSYLDEYTEAQRPHLALCGFLNCTSALR